MKIISTYGNNSVVFYEHDQAQNVHNHVIINQDTCGMHPTILSSSILLFVQ